MQEKDAQICEACNGCSFYFRSILIKNLLVETQFNSIGNYQLYTNTSMTTIFTYNCLRKVSLVAKLIKRAPPPHLELIGGKDKY